MGRAKIEIKKIEKLTKRKGTFSKRRAGLLKKAYEISVLSDVPVVLITFDIDGKLCVFSRHGRLEDTLIKFLMGRDEVQTNNIKKDYKKTRDSIIQLLEKIKREDDVEAGKKSRNGEGSSSTKPSEDDKQSDELKLMNSQSDDLVGSLKEIIWLLNQAPQTTTKHALGFCELKLKSILNLVIDRKNKLPKPTRDQIPTDVYSGQRQTSEMWHGQQPPPPMFMPSNANSLNCMQQHQTSMYAQQGPTTCDYNNSMHLANPMAQNQPMTYTQQVQEPVYNICQNNGRQILCGGNMPEQTQFPYCNEAGLPHGQLVQDMNQNRVQPQPQATSSRGWSDSSYQQSTYQTFSEGIDDIQRRY